MSREIKHLIEYQTNEIEYLNNKINSIGRYLVSLAVTVFFTIICVIYLLIVNAL